MRFQTLNEWLTWQETLHPATIELGLDRVRRVDQRLSQEPLARHVVMVAGTNGKGSTVAFLEAIYRAAGYRVACYTSPHVVHYNERIRLDGEPVDDATLCAAFERVDQARGETSLTYFEFGTLAAFDLFRRWDLDIAILEIGLGGRLDAVNIAEPDVSVITTIDLDHTQWLGDTREQIAHEKLGVARLNKALVIGELDPPAGMRELAMQSGARVSWLGQEFSFRLEQGQWQWLGAKRQIPALPSPALRGEFQYRNASVALQVVDALSQSLPVTHHEIRAGLSNAHLSGRLEAITHRGLQLWLDVAHNPQSVRVLAEEIARWPNMHTRYAVFGAMADKDIATMLRDMLPHIDHWFVCDLPVERAARGEVLGNALSALGVVEKRSVVCSSVAEAVESIAKQAPPNAQVIVFGSFYTVAAAKEFLEN